MNVLKLIGCSDQEISDYAQTKIENIQKEIRFCEYDNDYSYKLPDLYRQLQSIQEQKAKYMTYGVDDDESETFEVVEKKASKAWSVFRWVASGGDDKKFNTLN